jgi:hypothetical protein
MHLSQENPRESLITDQDAVTVPATMYYTRLIADGSLIIYRPTVEQKKKEAILPKKQEITNEYFKFYQKTGSYTIIDTSGANNALPSTRQEMVVIGQRLASGSVAANIPTSISSPEQAAVFWGAGSIIHRMAMAAFKQYPYLVLTGCAVDDAEASIAATATFTFAGKQRGQDLLLQYLVLILLLLLSLLVQLRQIQQQRLLPK